jgi:hypothetical protein
MEGQELKSEQAGKRLKLDQTRHEPAGLRANAEIDYEKIWVA